MKRNRIKKKTIKVVTECKSCKNKAEANSRKYKLRTTTDKNGFIFCKRCNRNLGQDYNVEPLIR